MAQNRKAWVLVQVESFPPLNQAPPILSFAVFLFFGTFRKSAVILFKMNLLLNRVKSGFGQSNSKMRSILNVRFKKKKKLTVFIYEGPFCLYKMGVFEGSILGVNTVAIG